MSKKIVYIIPLHKKDERVFDAIASIPEGTESIIVCDAETHKWFNKVGPKDIKENSHVAILPHDGKATYPSLVNAGILWLSEKDDVDYISILEFDDTLLPNAHKIINEYAEDWDDVEILTPLACVVKRNHEDKDAKPVLIGIANEASMAPQVAEEFGYFDFNMMLRTNFIFVNGCYIKPSVFEDYGKFKENFELFYDYEWALRVVYNGGIIRSIPKATHFHTLTEDGAFETQTALPSTIRDNWLGTARREYFFEDDREIKFD